MKNREIVIYTSNAAKMAEAKYVFDAFSINLTFRGIDFVEIQTDSLDEVVLCKIKQARKKKIYPFIVDDTGFYLSQYSNFPGVMSKLVYNSIGYKGILQLLSNEMDRTAHFKSVIGLVTENSYTLFEGITEGTVSYDIKGEQTTGLLFEPIFMPNGTNKTLAEMEWDTRMTFSYRKLPLTKIADAIQNT